VTESARVPHASVDSDNPWLGLEAFREADSRYFFGRDRACVELSRLVLENRLVILYGRSGLGKTSLLRAGVFPLLREAGALPIYVRLSLGTSDGVPSLSNLRDQLRRAIEGAVADTNVDAPPLDPESTLWEWFFRSEAKFFNERSRRVRPVLVFDQFEEAFTVARTTPDLVRLTDAFLDELADLVRGSVPAAVAARFARDSAAALEFTTDRDPCRVLLALRQEFLAEILRLRPRLPSLLDHRFELLGMTTEDAESAVTRSGGHLLDEGVAPRIVAFVASARRSSEDLPTDATTVDPAILNIFCRELNEKRQALRIARITADLVAGEQDAIIAGFYARSVEDISPAIQRFIEDRLVTNSGYRDSAPLEVALQLLGATDASINAINLLIERRLIRQEGIGGRARLELTHDLLTTPIVQSRNLRRVREQEEHKRFAESEESARRAEAQERTRLAELRERDALVERQARRRGRVSLVVLGVLLIVVGYLVFTMYATR
jgi:hypothetical protein